MQATAATMPAESASGALSKPSTSNLVRLDQRTRLARRINELRGIYIDALGGERAVTPVMLTRVESAAHLKACAETARSRYLIGDGVIDDVVRAENMAARAERALSLREKVARASVPDLQDYLAQRAAGAAA